MAFADERDTAERALEMSELNDVSDPVFPPVAQRFLRAREALGLTHGEVAAQWGERPSMYWDLELYDDEAFHVISIQDLVTLAGVLHVSIMHLLFGGEPCPPLSVTSYQEVVRRLRAKMTEGEISVDQISETVGWELADILNNPERLADLPIFGLRWVCTAVSVDWATTLGNPTARRTTRCT